MPHTVYNSYQGHTETLKSTLEEISETNREGFNPPSELMYGFQPMTSTETLPPSINWAVTNENVPSKYSDIKSDQKANYNMPRQKSSSESIVKHLSSFLEPFMTKIRYFIEG